LSGQELGGCGQIVRHAGRDGPLRDAQHRPRSCLSRMARAIAESNRAVSDVAREYQVSWPTAHKALVSAAAAWLPEPEPTSGLGIDETRFRSVRWILDGITWKRSDPWLTSFVDCSRDGPGSLLGLAPGRTGACVREWLGEQSEAFRRRIEIVVMSLSSLLCKPCGWLQVRGDSVGVDEGEGLFPVGGDLAFDEVPFGFAFGSAAETGFLGAVPGPLVLDAADG
jgi:hypothetical protein